MGNTLFDQFGGEAKMSIFVEDFMEGVMGDNELACYHDKFKDPYEMELLKEKLCQFFKWKLDGSRFYIGKPMPEVHRNLGITDEIFDKACEVFTASLKKLKPKLRVMREFVKRVGGIRDQIVFPPASEEADQKCEEFELSPGEEGAHLLKFLGEETGLRNIVDSALELAADANLRIFKKMKEGESPHTPELVSKFSIYLASMLDTRYAWYQKEASTRLQVLEEDFEALIGLMRTASVKNNVAKPAIVSFVEFLSGQKEVICGRFVFLRGATDFESMEYEERLERFIQRFYVEVHKSSNQAVIRALEETDCRVDVINRMSKVLQCQRSDEMVLDPSVLDYPEDSVSDVMVQISDLLCHTLVTVGVDS